MEKMPKWADVILIPAISILLAAIISGVVLLATGKDPLNALVIMFDGAVGSSRAWGYTLYYATNFIFTGLAVAVAFHARMFNIGGEGQALLGGVGVAVACLYIPWPHWTLALLGAMVLSGIFGAIWAAIPAFLQAKRGSHIVITTIMFNFIAYSLINHLLVNVMKPAGVMEPATASFPEATHLPNFHDILGLVGIDFAMDAPANLAFFVALLACLFLWALIWRTRIGYQIRQFGESESAARYAGVSPTKIIMISMILSGMFAGMMSINNVMGEAERLVLNSAEGAGFIGIAVALMGRNHPVGIVLAAILFGFLYQGGTQLSIQAQIPKEMVVVIQSLVILFTGALDHMVRSPVERIFLALRRKEA
ncbi:MAG: ABC transporter permease [Marivivens sp.]|nr:ABC transporter permease [Paracoccaceae bacterium]